MVVGMGEVPEELKYTEEHEWVRVEGDEVSIGITDFAQNALTEVVWVEPVSYTHLTLPTNA